MKSKKRKEKINPAPSVKRIHSQVHQLTKCQGNGLVRRSIERWHLVHNALGVMPVSNSEQSFQQTKLLVVWGLRGHKMYSWSDCI